MLHQASCVSIGGRGLMIEGAPGSGKSALALALIDRGATLVGDDGVLLERRGPALVAAPPPAIRGKFEIRNVGIVDLPVTTAPVSLILRLDTAAPRFVEAAGAVTMLGIAVPLLAFAIDPVASAVRAEHALRVHGMQAEN